MASGRDASNGSPAATGPTPGVYKWPYSSNQALLGWTSNYLGTRGNNMEDKEMNKQTKETQEEAETKTQEETETETEQRQLLLQLEKEETEAFIEIGRRIRIIEKVVKESRNIHKPIRDGITEAAIFYQRMQEHRRELKKAREEQQQQWEQAGVGPHEATGNRMSSHENRAAPQIRKKQETSWRDVAEKTPRVALRRAISEKKRVASSPPKTMMPGKKRKDEKEKTEGDEQEDTRRRRINTQEPVTDGSGWERVDRRKERRAKSTRKPAVPRIQSRTEAIAVKTKGESYKDTVRKIKAQIEPEKCGVKIARIRETRTGDILVEIQKGSEGTEALRKAVAEASDSSQ